MAVVLLGLAARLPAQGAQALPQRGGREYAGISFPRPEAGYRLPVTRPSTILQGNHGAFSHADRFNRYAWDFHLPDATPVTAARAGLVVYARDDSHIGGEDRALFYNESNTLTLDHLDGTRTFYLHLKNGGNRVRVGDYVIRGEVIAESGHTGWCGTPHLHFTLLDASTLESIPLRFSDVEENDGVPLEEQRVPAARPPAVAQATIDAYKRAWRASLKAEALGALDLAFVFTTTLPPGKKHEDYFYHGVLIARRGALLERLAVRLGDWTGTTAPLRDQVLEAQRCLELLSGVRVAGLGSRLIRLRDAAKAWPLKLKLRSRSVQRLWIAGLQKECLEEVTGAAGAYVAALKKAPFSIRPLIRFDLERLIQADLRSSQRSFNRLVFEAERTLPRDRAAIRMDADRIWKRTSILLRAWADHFPGEREIALLERADSLQKYAGILKLLGPK